MGPKFTSLPLSCLSLGLRRCCDLLFIAHPLSPASVQVPSQKSVTLRKSLPPSNTPRDHVPCCVPTALKWECCYSRFLCGLWVFFSSHRCGHIDSCSFTLRRCLKWCIPEEYLMTLLLLVAALCDLESDPRAFRPLCCLASGAEGDTWCPRFIGHSRPLSSPCLHGHERWRPSCQGDCSSVCSPELSLIHLGS